MGSTLWGEWIHYDYQALMGESTLSLEYCFKTILKKNGDGSCVKEINILLCKYILDVYTKKSLISYQWAVPLWDSWTSDETTKSSSRHHIISNHHQSIIILHINCFLISCCILSSTTTNNNKLKRKRRRRRNCSSSRKWLRDENSGFAPEPMWMGTRIYIRSIEGKSHQTPA